MTIPYISPFFKAAYTVMCEFFSDTRVSRGKIYRRVEAIEQFSGLVVIVGLMGEAEGHILLSMDEMTAIAIASELNQEEFIEVSPIVSSTIQELANILSGRAVTELYEKGIVFDITPPMVLTGQHIRLARTHQEVLILPLKIDEAVVNIHITTFDKIAQIDYVNN